jgi:VanZ family protein
VGHFFLYGIVDFLIDRALFHAAPQQSRKSLAIKCGLLLALLIGIEEFSQQFFASRTFDLIDLAFSYLGVFCFSWLALKLKK